jgi:hypothetical protein
MLIVRMCKNPVGVPAYIVRVKEEQERQLYFRHELYVGIRRDWAEGSKILFAKKAAAGEAFAGSGVFEKIVEADAMGEDERSRCIANNWYGRIVFTRLARFLPPVPLRDTPVAGRPVVLLHGLEITDDEAARIENLAASRIIT